jgi:hypothetical protein
MRDERDDRRDREELEARVRELEARVRELRDELGEPPRGPGGLPAAEHRDRLAEVGHRHDRRVGSEARLGGVAVGDEHPPHPGLAEARHRGQHTGDGLDGPVEAELADGGDVVERVAGHLALGLGERQRHGEVEAGAGLGQVGG